MSIYKLTFDKNIERVESLNAIYAALKEDNKRDGKDYKFTDILRAEVVFLHSAFEEYLRCILIHWIPVKANDETLKEFPISLSAGKKPEKLYLSDLAHFRDKKVNDIIRESVEKTMQLKSFNSEGDIKAWCSKIGISLDGFEKIKEIDKAVHRRHKIVHEADINKNDEKRTERLQSIKPGDLTPWIEAYKELVNLIESKINEWENINVTPDS